jgi:hypothetical protein
VRTACGSCCDERRDPPTSYVTDRVRDEREELWKASVRAYTARRREQMRAAWCEHHQGQAARLRTALEALIADHEEQAERYRDQPEGAA